MLPQPTHKARKISSRSTVGVLGCAITLLGFAVLLAWISNHFQGVQGWSSFLAISGLGAAFLILSWWALRGESPPRWLAVALAAAVVLRLGAGVVWFTLLPQAGYNSPAELGGYVMADAHERDQAAWDLASSDKPLLRAFQGSYHKADQYGGLLYLSAFLYRFLGSSQHQPLQIVVLTAFFSSLAVLFTWAMARRAWGEAAGRLAALALVLYPEAILLGSSQMREAFTVTLTAAAFYGLVRYLQDHSRTGLVWIAAALLASLPFSPPFSALLAGMLLLVAMFSTDRALIENMRQQRWFRWALLGLVLLGATGLWLAWKRFAPEGISDPLAVIGYWVRKSAEWQAHLSERASGMVQKIFDSTPPWSHPLLLILYGVVQPLLPAALSDITGVRLWRVIAIWRGLGWTVLLPFLAYAPLRAFSRLSRDRFARGASLAIWIVILSASFRSGGDMWDNPRYRAMFAGLQVAIAAWVWVDQQRQADPRLRRVLAAAALILAWFLPWYLRRYPHLPWPISDIFKTLGLGIASAVLYWTWDWAGIENKKNDQG